MIGGSLNNQTYDTQFVWEVPALPDLSSAKLSRLGGSLPERHASLVRDTSVFMQVFRQMRPRGASVALRLVRSLDDPEYIGLFLVVRVRGTSALNGAQADDLRRQYESILPNRQHYRYTYLGDSSEGQSPVTYGSDWIGAKLLEERRRKATTVGPWARYGFELVKRIDLLPSIRNVLPAALRDVIPKYWEVPARRIEPKPNTLESVCAAILRSRGHVMVDITLAPADPGEEAKRSVNDRKEYLASFASQQYVSGLVIPADGHAGQAYNVYSRLQQDLVENPTWYLYGIRLFTDDGDAGGVIEALAASANANGMSLVALHGETGLFERAIAAAEHLDILPEINQGSDEWTYLAEEIGVFAPELYRLHRMATADELGGFWTLPVSLGSQFPGFSIDYGQASIPLRSGRDSAVAIELGRSSEGRAVRIKLSDLTRHLLMVGTSGAGKTSTMFEIARQLQEHGIPWLVLEPAKSEYRALRSIDPGVSVFTLGNERAVPFRFNPLDVPEGTALEMHVGRLVTCFLGAFNLWDPLPMLLEKSLRRVYDEAGWLMSDIGGAEGNPPPPTIAHLHDMAGRVVEASGYHEGEVMTNIRAALLGRLESLRRGSIGRMLGVERGLTIADLMSRPVVLELDALNHDEKSLVMMFLFVHVYQYSRYARVSNTGLQHVLILEEAHNLIGTVSSEGAERANPRRYAAEMFVNMLAEMRALGEGIVIVDQLPSSLAPQAMKNTSTKVVHQLLAGDDREAVGLTMGIRPDDPRGLEPIGFQPGEAFVFAPAAAGPSVSRMEVQLSPEIRSLRDQPPPTDAELRYGSPSMPAMLEVLGASPEIFLPYAECSLACRHCTARARDWSESRLDSVIREAIKRVAPAKAAGIYVERISREGGDYGRYRALKDADLEAGEWASMSRAVADAVDTFADGPPRLANQALQKYCTVVHLSQTETGQKCSDRTEVLRQLASEEVVERGRK